MNICIFIADIDVADSQGTRIGDNLIEKKVSMGQLTSFPLKYCALLDCDMLTHNETAINDMFMFL